MGSPYQPPPVTAGNNFTSRHSSFAMLVYNTTGVAGGGAGSTTYNDFVAAKDPEFSQRNNHYIFSEYYKLIAWESLGASLLDVRFNIPSWNAICRAHQWPMDLSATPQSVRRISDFRDFHPDLPVNEEIAIEATNNLATTGTENETSAIWIAPPNWSRNYPPYHDQPATELPGGGRLRRFVLRATATVTAIAHAWSTLQALTFAENLRGGWYCVHSAWVQNANARYFRLVFPRQPLYRGRRLRPGSVITNAIGNVEWPVSENFFGVWGYFHSFEPPQLEIFDDAGNSDACEIRLDCSYYGYPAPPGYDPTGAEIQ